MPHKRRIFPVKTSRREDNGKYITIWPQGYTWEVAILVYDFIAQHAQKKDPERPWEDIFKNSFVKVNLDIELRILHGPEYYKTSIPIYIEMPNKKFQQMVKEIKKQGASNDILDSIRKHVVNGKKVKYIYTGYIIESDAKRLLKEKRKIILSNSWVCNIHKDAPVKHQTKEKIIPWAKDKNFKNIQMLIPYKGVVEVNGKLTSQSERQKTLTGLESVDILGELLL